MASIDKDNALIINAKIENQWFTAEHQIRALTYWSSVLTPDQLEKWTSNYTFSSQPKRIGLIMAGNIPMVGMHDLLCILLSGHCALIKYSTDDKQLMQWFRNTLINIDSNLEERMLEVETLNQCDALIATGSNNTSRYFESYFSHVPRIIRKNRSSLAVLSGNETLEDLKNLSHDILDYFGLGCRNVSKLLVPEGYNFNLFFEALEFVNTIMHHNKYFNNYTYHKAIFLMNLAPHLDNGFLILKLDPALFSPLGCLFYSHYTSHYDIDAYLETHENSIQIVVSDPKFIANSVPFGQSQSPRLIEYADKVDTFQFLNEL